MCTCLVKFWLSAGPEPQASAAVPAASPASVARRVSMIALPQIFDRKLQRYHRRLASNRLAERDRRDRSGEDVGDDAGIPADVLLLRLLAELPALTGLGDERLRRCDLAVLRRITAADLYGVVGFDQAPAGVGVARRKGTTVGELAPDHHRR